MKVLFIGDIVGEPGRKAVKALLPGIIRKRKINCVIANAENSAGGSGITPPIAKELKSYKLDVITSGDHIWKRREIVEILDREQTILRPLNYPKEAPGFGSAIIELPEHGVKIGVVNLVGRVFMQAVECPFRTSREEVGRMRKITPNIFVDMHAEATSEKIALGWYLDGLVTAVMGTHTHVQTADEKILPEGTAYITDVGMTGPFDSVIGRKKEQILTRFITQMPTRFQMADADIWLNAVVIDFDDKTGKANSIERIQKKYM
ncbi:MAG: TIGR00282 family metallophosphoesterase [Candidatus Omnitrophota bacterium]|nr:MAG: TIGR00282 family metallophosphoesterase [Candidatus Omnitrophota bacterium]